MRTQQFNIGPLNMLAVDYGDQVLLGNAMQQALGEGNPSESNQCTIVSVAAALEWHAQRWRKRIPSRNRVNLLASSIREAEFAATQQGMKELAKATTVFEAEIETALHDPLHPNHARDLRTLGFFLFKDIVDSNDVDFCIFEVSSHEMTTVAHVFRGGGEKREKCFSL